MCFVPASGKIWCSDRVKSMRYDKPKIMKSVCYFLGADGGLSVVRLSMENLLPMQTLARCSIVNR